MNYYRVLGVEPQAETKEIKRAYRRLAKEFHPDVNRHDPHAEELFQRIAEAYSVLSDKEERAYYDMQLRAQSVSHVPHNPYSHVPQGQVFTTNTTTHSWEAYLRGFEEQEAYPNYRSKLRHIPLFHRFFLAALAALVVLFLLALDMQMAIISTVSLLLFGAFSSWWLYRMDTSLMTRHQAASFVEIILVYLMSAFVAALATLPIAAAILLGMSV